MKRLYPTVVPGLEIYNFNCGVNFKPTYFNGAPMGVPVSGIAANSVDVCSQIWPFALLPKKRMLPGCAGSAADERLRAVPGRHAVAGAGCAAYDAAVHPDDVVRARDRVGVSQVVADERVAAPWRRLSQDGQPRCVEAGRAGERVDQLPAVDRAKQADRRCGADCANSRRGSAIIDRSAISPRRK